MRRNRALAAWRAGGGTIGGWLTIGNAYTAEFMAGLGFDWLCVDMQHGVIGYEDLARMLPALSTGDATPLARVPWNAPSEIMKALDAGAYGVIVPMVNNRAEAQRAVAACRYPPRGMRSFGPTRAVLYGGADYVDGADGEIACIAMVETAEGLANLDAIAATPGLDAIYIGPADLGYALGLGAGQDDAPAHVQAVSRIKASCRKHGIAVGIHSTTPARAQQRLGEGFNLVAIGSDGGFLARAATEELAAAREACAGSADAA